MKISDANVVTSPVTPTSTGFLPSAGSPLPQDILERGRARVRIAALVMAGTWCFVVIMNEGVKRILGASGVGDVWNHTQSLLTLLGLFVSLAVAWLIPRLKGQAGLALDIGLYFEVFNALIISLISETYARHDPQAVSWVCVTIVLWPALAPASPRKTFMASMAAATTVPLAMWLSYMTHPGYTILDNFILSWLLVPAYVCAFLAMVPATVIRGLGKQVHKARSLGSYELEDRIGKGGMGEVYRARHRLLARPAAVKLISPDALQSSTPDANRVIVERFRREAQAAATLRSPHTIELYDYGVSEDGTFYYVMELLDGIDFHDLIRRHGPVSPERAIHLLLQACDSLGEAHLKGMVHRDVKPSNILACRMGLKVDYVKVLDFGLVKSEVKGAGENLHLTSADVVSGTPAFLAPESISGITSVGPPADVYALGCVAYWLVTGQYVFQAPNATMMLMQHLQAAPVPPSHRAPAPIPQDFEQLILRCLSKDPVARPRDAAELSDLLKKCRSPKVWSDDSARDWWGSHSLAAPAGVVS